MVTDTSVYIPTTLTASVRVGNKGGVKESMKVIVDSKKNEVLNELNQV